MPQKQEQEMTFAPLSVMSRALRKCPRPSLDWKGGDPDDAIGEINEDYIEEFNQINSHAAVAYVIATVEWIYWYVRERLRPVDAQNYQEYIVANWVWACTLPRKVPLVDYEFPDDQDPTLSWPYDQAVRVGLRSIRNGIFAERHHETAVSAAFMTQLCEYVLPNECGFQTWRIAVLERLKRQFPDGRQPYDQTCISRRLFDTDVDLQQIDHAADCAAMLSDASLFANNRYLPLDVPED